MVARRQMHFKNQKKKNYKNHIIGTPIIKSLAYDLYIILTSLSFKLICSIYIAYVDFNIR